mgnify:CR=1 FL=1
MKYYIDKTLDAPFEAALLQAREALKSEGFGVLSEIDIKEKFREKLDIDFRHYTILGACNPPLAYDALKAENKIGAMLPCNVVVQESEDGMVEVAAVDPVQPMKAIDNAALTEIAETVRSKLKNVIERL